MLSWNRFAKGIPKQVKRASQACRCCGEEGPITGSRIERNAGEARVLNLVCLFSGRLASRRLFLTPVSRIVIFELELSSCSLNCWKSKLFEKVLVKVGKCVVAQRWRVRS